jgi:hypothetical protein
VNDKLEVRVALQTEGNSTISVLHKPRGYAQGLLVEADCVVGMNKLPYGVKQREWGQASNWVPDRSRPNVVETRLDTNTKEQSRKSTTR